MKLTSPSVILQLLEKYQFRFSKGLGQNFLINPAVCPKMAQLCAPSGDYGVIEIGPGFGVLTAALAEQFSQVVAVELDQRLFPVLNETLAEYPNVTLVQGDAMQLDFAALIQQQLGGKKAVLCANLPYYITSPILMRLLEQHVPVEAITVMVQKEAAERICAQPGTRACGALSIAVQYYAVPEVLFYVPRTSFMPAPNVDSAVIRLTLRQSPPAPIAEERLFFRMVKAGFAQRRKVLPGALSSGMGIQKETIRSAMRQCGIPENYRIEQLSMEQLAALSNSLNS